MLQMFYVTHNIVAVFLKGDMGSYNDWCFESWNNLVAFLDKTHADQYVLQDFFDETHKNHGISGLSIFASESL